MVQCIAIGPVCGFVCLQRAGDVQTLLQPERAQCLHLSEHFLGRLPKVDLIILERGENVRPYVRPATKSFFDLNEIWYIGRGR